MKNLQRSCLAFAVVLISAAAVHAAPTTSYGALPGAGVYYGTGNLDKNWTIGQDNSVILGLGFKDRQTFQLLDGSSGTYSAALGHYSGSGSKEHLSYQFSGQGTTSLSYQLCIDHDPSSGTSFSCVDPLTYWTDNNTAGAGTFQNSENIGFADTPGGAFDPTANGLYTFTLTAFRAGVSVDAVRALVQIGDPLVVPEPGTLALIGVGLAGLAASRRRKAS